MNPRTSQPVPRAARAAGPAAPGCAAVPARALDDAVWLRSAYVRDGASQRQIAALVGASPSTVSRALARHGIPVRAPGRPPTVPDTRPGTAQGGAADRPLPQAHTAALPGPARQPGLRPSAPVAPVPFTDAPGHGPVPFPGPLPRAAEQSADAAPCDAAGDGDQGRRPGRRALRRTLIAAVALVGAGVSAAMTYSAFSSQRTYAGNDLTSGSVTLGGDAAAGFEFDLANMKPGDSAERCVTLTYSGTLDADVHLYGTATGALAPYVDLTVGKGAAADGTAGGTCATFTQTAPLFTGLLSAYPTTYAAGVDDTPAWTQGTTRVYRVRVELRDDSAAQSKSVTASFSWEARNR